MISKKGFFLKFFCFKSFFLYITPNIYKASGKTTIKIINRIELPLEKLKLFQTLKITKIANHHTKIIIFLYIAKKILNFIVSLISFSNFGSK